MKLLLDTHIFLWFRAGSPQLPERLRAIISDENNEVFLSLASVWELQIKSQLGKLDIARPLRLILVEEQDKNALQLLPITPDHIFGLDALPNHHRDPFDRLILSQALIENMVLVSVDEIFQLYSVPLVR